MHERLGILIDGKWVSSTGTETFTIINPTSQEPHGVVSVGSSDDVERAVASAHRALQSAQWRSTSIDERCEIVRRLAVLLQERAPELARLQSETMGSPYKINLYLGNATELIEMYVDSVQQVSFESIRCDQFGNSLITRNPVGVVGAIVPWNAPIRSEVKKVVPALLAGCTVVLKPALETALSAAAFGDLCLEAGVPPGVVNVVPGGPRTGEALVSHPLVRKIAFTGSTATGAKIAASASDTFKRLQLELGGKSAAILLPDFDLAQTLPVLVRANWANAGQLCVALSRTIVPRHRYAEVVDAFAAEAERQVVGDPLAPPTTMGPLFTEQQRARVLQHLDRARSDGVRVAAGGGPADLDRGWFVSPTVLADVDNSMNVAQNEIFGPVASLIPYDSEEEAVAIANDSPYGLHGAVFSADPVHALEVARLIDTGSVAINGFNVASSAPFGGVKQSGVGREHGPEGFDSFLEYASYNIPAALVDTLKDGLNQR